MRASIWTKRNMMIICLLVLGASLYGYVNGIVIPRMEQEREQYLAEQQHPLTHDLNYILPYANKYMGNASNLGNLFSSLPLMQYTQKYQLHPDSLTAEVFYRTTHADLDEQLLDQSLLYNATAAFALIDNLQGLHFHFGETRYQVRREDVESWYGVNLSALLEQQRWREQVQEPLREEKYVKEGKKAMFGGQEQLAHSGADVAIHSE